MNIGEIAQLAGVSRSTVSYVLSGKRQVSRKTRSRVLAIIDETNYRPSATARALSNGATSTVAVLVPRLHHHLNIEILQFVGAIAEAAAEHGFDTLLSPSGGGEREDVIEKLVGEKRVDGILLMETSIHDGRIDRLVGRGFPFITIGRTGRDNEHDWVDIDYEGLVRDAVTILAARGHTRIALVNRPRELLEHGYNLAVNAAAGFQSICADLGVHGVMVCGEEDTDDAGERCVADIQSADPGVSAIVSVNDRSLGALMDALSARNLKVPKDMSIIAVAPDRVAGRTVPPVTAADVPATGLATRAVETLLSRIDATGAIPPVRELVKSTFTDRGSIGKRRVDPTDDEPRTW